MLYLKFLRKVEDLCREHDMSKFSKSDVIIVDISPAFQLIGKIRSSFLHIYLMKSTERMIIGTQSHRKPTQRYLFMRCMFQFSYSEDKPYTVVLYTLNSTERVLIQAETIHMGALIEFG